MVKRRIEEKNEERKTSKGGFICESANLNAVAAVDQLRTANSA